MTPRGIRIGMRLALLITAGCGDPSGGFALRAPDRATFDAQVMPVLARDCSFHACHGARQRFFQLVGPGRPRLSPISMDGDPITIEELQFNYGRARSMIDREDPARSLLFLKPLAASAGGYGHLGTDLFGRDVYDSQVDPSFMVLQNWALGAPLEGVPNQPQPAAFSAMPVPGTQPGGP